MSDTRDTIRAVRFGWVALILGVATYALTVAGLMVWGQLDFGMIGTRAMRIVAGGVAIYMAAGPGRSREASLRCT